MKWTTTRILGCAGVCAGLIAALVKSFIENHTVDSVCDIIHFIAWILVGIYIFANMGKNKPNR